MHLWEVYEAVGRILKLGTIAVCMGVPGDVGRMASQVAVVTEECSVRF